MHMHLTATGSGVAEEDFSAPSKGLTSLPAIACAYLAIGLIRVSAVVALASPLLVAWWVW
jgi:hypothetical protein